MSAQEDQLIDSYVNNLLSEEDRLRVMERMKSDIEFREKVQLELDLLNTLNPTKWSFLRDKDSSLVKEYQTLFDPSNTHQLKKAIQEAQVVYQQTEKQSTKRWVWYVAAAILVVFISIASLWETGSSAERLYANYVDLENLPSLAVRGETNESGLTAQRLFENKKYEQALEIFGTLDVDEIDNKSVYYIYSGLTQIELEQWDDAKETFNQLLSSDLLDAGKANWYLALMHVKMEQPEIAKAYLEKVVAENKFKHKEASDLLLKLD